MIDYFVQATHLLLGENFYINYSWASALEDILVLIYAIIIIITAFKLFKFLVYGWWSKWL